MLHQQQAATSGMVNDLGQLDIAVRAITINTTSKLTYSDVLLFRSLLKRIFPECEQKTMEDAELEARLTEVATKKKLALYPDLVRKSEIIKYFSEIEWQRQPTDFSFIIWKSLMKVYRALRTNETKNWCGHLWTTCVWKDCPMEIISWYKVIWK